MHMVQVLKNLYYLCFAQVLCHEVIRVVLVLDLDYLEIPDLHSLLDPKLVHCDVLYFAKASSGSYGSAFGCVSEHFDVQVYSQIFQQALQSDRSGCCFIERIQLCLASG